MRGYGYLRLPLLVVLLSMPAATSSARDFESAEERFVDRTGYTGANGQWAIDAGMFGVGYEDLVASLGVRTNLHDRIRLGLNVAHSSVGLLNVNSKFGLFASPVWGLALSTEFIWAHGDWVWIADEEERAVLEGIDVFLIPLRLLGTWNATPSFSIDAGLGYDHLEFIGNLNNTNLFYDGAIGGRQLLFQFFMRLHTWDTTVWSLGTRIPYWGQAPGQIEAATQIAEGVIVGTRAAGYLDVSPWRHAVVLLSAEAELTHLLYMRAGISIGNMAEEIYGTSLQPSLHFEKRFE